MSFQPGFHSISLEPNILKTGILESKILSLRLFLSTSVVKYSNEANFTFLN